MTTIDFTQIANILEKDIVPSVKNQLYKKAALWQIFGGFKAEQDANVERRVNPVGISFKNNTIYVTTQNGNPAVGATGIGNNYIYGAVPTNQGSLSISTTTGAFKLPKEVMNVKNEGSIVDTIQFNIMGMTNSMAHDLNRQCYGDGTATLAYVAASGSATKTITLKPKATASTLYNGDIPLAVRFFHIGDSIKIGSNSITTVTAIPAANTITVADNQTMAANDAIVKYDGSNAIASEMTGLAKIVSTGDTYMAIDGTLDATWNAALVGDNSGSPKTYADGDWNDAFYSAQATGDVKYVICNKTEFEKYGQSNTQLKRFAGDDILSGGWRGLEFMGGNAVVVLDYDCPDDRVYFLSPDNLFRAEFQGLQFEPGTMGNAMRLTGSLTYEIVSDIMGNIGTFVRSSNSVLTNRVA